MAHLTSVSIVILLIMWNSQYYIFYHNLCMVAYFALWVQVIFLSNISICKINILTCRIVICQHATKSWWHARHARKLQSTAKKNKKINSSKISNTAHMLLIIIFVEMQVISNLYCKLNMMTMRVKFLCQHAN